MEEFDFKIVYKIDKERLLNYYERLKKQNTDLQPLQLIAKFLENQSIGTSFDDISEILTYFAPKIREDKTLLDFALEWIRAYEIRLEYKKYISRATYPEGDLNLPVDDCISLFFLQYNSFIRNLLQPEIQEHEIAALLEIFFSPYETINLDLNEILKQQKSLVPTIHEGSKKIDTSITTLRSGLSQIIINDYDGVYLSQKEDSKMKQGKELGKIKSTKQDDMIKFSGSLIERMLKYFCLSKNKIQSKEIERAISQFLSSHFQFGTLYKFEDFEKNIVPKLLEDVYFGLSEGLRKNYSRDVLKALISKELKDFTFKYRYKQLDGSAWKDDLTPILKNFISTFMNRIFQPGELHEIEGEEGEETTEQELNFDSIFDLTLDIEEYREKLEKMVNKTRLGLIEKTNLIRSKMQEFREKKRKRH